MGDAEQKDGDVLTRRQVLFRLGSILTAMGVMGAPAEADNTLPQKDTAVRRNPKGSLVLMGGAVSPGHKLYALAKEIGIDRDRLEPASEMLEKLKPEEIKALAAKCDASGIFADMQKHRSFKGKTVICVTSASANAKANARLDEIEFRLHGAKDVICIATREEADTDDMAKKISDPKTALVFFDGGAQERLAKNFMGTKAYEAMRKRFIEDSTFTVAGSSAGAAVMPGKGAMIKDWNDKNTGPDLSTGFGLVDHIIVDTHLHRSKVLPRLPRLQKAVEARPDCIGLGLDEGTGVMIKDGVATVIGAQKVWKITRDDTSTGLPDLLKKGVSKGERIMLGDHAAIPVPRGRDDGKDRKRGRN